MNRSRHGAFVAGPVCRVAPTTHGAGAPLAGFEFAVKDLIDVAGFVTGCGNPDRAADQAPAQRHAPAVAALLGAGAAVAGKTLTDELAFSLEGENHHYGTPVNPRCPDRLPGGSSSGSAVAVAAGFADFALGTDTGGSVRVPAAFCGVFGFRPTHGRVPLDGVMPLAPSYDTVGWFAATGKLLQRVGRVLLGDAAAQPPARLVVARDAFALADPACASALAPIARTLGARDEVDVYAGAAAEWLAAYRVLQGREIWQVHGEWIERRRPRLGPAIAPRFADAASIADDAVAHCQTVRTGLRAALDRLLPEGTALVLPTTPSIALARDASGEARGEFYRVALTLTSIAGHAGLPQVTLPLATLAGCPLGVSVIGWRGGDHALLALAARTDPI